MEDGTGSSDWQQRGGGVSKQRSETVWCGCILGAKPPPPQCAFGADPFDTVSGRALVKGDRDGLRETLADRTQLRIIKNHIKNARKRGTILLRTDTFFSASKSSCKKLHFLNPYFRSFGSNWWNITYWIFWRHLDVAASPGQQSFCTKWVPFVKITVENCTNFPISSNVKNVHRSEYIPLYIICYGKQ